MSTAVAVPQQQQKPGGLGTLQKLLEQYKGQIAMALPKHMTPERMIRVALTAVSSTPALKECDPLSIAACIVQASILGLEPSSVLGEAYLVPFNTKVKGEDGRERWVKQCQLIPGYQGLLKLVRNSGELLMVNAQIVRERDRFDFEDGLDPYLVHKRADGDRGAVVAYWAGAVLKGGGKQFVVMTRHECEEHRNKYSKGWEKQGDSSTWGKEFDQMSLKTCIRKLCKLLPKSIEAQIAVSLDERHESGMPQQFSVDVPLELQPQQPAGEITDGQPPVEMPTRASAKKQSEPLPDPMSVPPNSELEHGGKLYTNKETPEGPAWVEVKK